MDAAELRPLAIGEILDVAIKIYRSRFASLVKVVAVVVTPVSVLGALVRLSTSSELDLLLTPGVTGPDPEGSEIALAMSGFLVVGLLGFIASQLATAASLRILSGAYLGEVPGWKESLRFAASKLASLVWLAMLLGFFLVLGFLACVIPAAYLYVAWAVATPVLLVEDVRGRRALKRSRALVKGRWWPMAALLLLSIILAGIVQLALSGLLVGVVEAGDNDVVRAVAEAIADSAASVLTTPFTAAVIVAAYFDLRVRKEGFDLELLARHVGVETFGGGGGEPGVLPPLPPSPGADTPYWPPPPGRPPPDA